MPTPAASTTGHRGEERDRVPRPNTITPLCKFLVPCKAHAIQPALERLMEPREMFGECVDRVDARRKRDRFLLRADEIAHRSKVENRDGHVASGTAA